MLLARASHARVERFFREHRGEPGLTLPPVYVHGSLVAWLLTVLAGGMSGITFGRHVFVRPSLVRRDAEGRARVPAPLLVHEATHVLQYEERGFAPFLFDYVREYLRLLRAGGRWGAQRRMAAYLAIGVEREAREAEHAYASWSAAAKEALPT